MWQSALQAAQEEAQKQTIVLAQIKVTPLIHATRTRTHAHAHANAHAHAHVGGGPVRAANDGPASCRRAVGRGLITGFHLVLSCGECERRAPLWRGMGIHAVGVLPHSPKVLVVGHHRRVSISALILGNGGPSFGLGDGRRRFRFFLIVCEHKQSKAA